MSFGSCLLSESIDCCKGCILILVLFLLIHCVGLCFFFFVEWHFDAHIDRQSF